MRPRRGEAWFADATNSTSTGDPEGIITVLCECIVSDEEIELILDTMSAHHFNFIAKDLGPGDHVISVEIEGSTTASSSNSDATVGVGNGTLSVEEVRAVNDGSGIDFNN